MKSASMKILSAILFSCGISFAAAPACPTLMQGTAAYKAQNYDAAIDAWQTCVDAGYRSADLFYDLGNAYFREKRIGFSILYYESALRIDPSNDDYRHNLKFAQALTKDKVEGDGEENPILTALFRAHHFLSLKAQLWTIVGLVWLIVILLVLRVLSKNPAHKNAFYYVVFPIAIILGIIAMSAGHKAYVLVTEKKGVVTAANTNVMSSPDESSRALNALSEGTTFDVTGIREGWVQIRLGEKVNGFVRTTDVGIVK